MFRPDRDCGPLDRGPEDVLPTVPYLKGNTSTSQAGCRCHAAVRSARSPAAATVTRTGGARKPFVYSVKFVCGTGSDACGYGAVAPGAYATEVNIHNYWSHDVTLDMRYVLLVSGGAAVGGEPQTAGSRIEDKLVLPPHAATMIDWCRIGELLLHGAGSSAAPLTIGFLEIVASADIAVTAVYTGGAHPAGISLTVEQITGRLA